LKRYPVVGYVLSAEPAKTSSRKSKNEGEKRGYWNIKGEINETKGNKT